MKLKIIYNVSTRLNKPLEPVLEEDVNACFEIFNNEGLLGDFNVNEYGLISKGFSNKTNVFLRGGFDIFVKNDYFDDFTLKEIIEQQLLFSSSEDERKQEVLELAKNIEKEIAYMDIRSRVLTWGQYTDTPVFKTFGIDTPLGFQSAHIHLDNDYKNIIQYFKPQKSNQWYDFDQFKRFLWGRKLDNLRIRESSSLRQKGSFAVNKIINYRRNKKIDEYVNMIMQGKVDYIENINL